MQAIILAAGMGKRLGSYTKENTKCMVEVNGTTLIERMISILDRKNLSKIIIVVGYMSENLIEYVGKLKLSTPICFIENKIYDKTNNIYSLSLAKEYLIQEDTLLLESDLIFEESLIDMLLTDKRETLALVDKFESWMDGTCLVVDDEDYIKDFIPGKYLEFKRKNEYYKTVNIYKFSKSFSEKCYMPFLEAYSKTMGNNEYYETVIKLIVLLDKPQIKAKRLSGQLWYEIDDIQDLDIASTLFISDPVEKYEQIMKRFGGYWRFPKLLDFCYLVNPYYPSHKMLEEMKSNFESLITEYPSGMKVNSLLASRNFGVRPEHIIVGNGAAELIRILVGYIEGNVGFIRPTFEEYVNRYPKNKSIVYISDKEGFSYNSDDIINYFEGKDISALILINPDNPSGNYIKRNGILHLIEWAKKKSVKLIVDESFVDFAMEEDASLIQEDIINLYSELYVIKSISKSFGIPGIRLGVLATSNEDFIERMKKDLPIWNINSFGEFYMQIEEKYKKDYKSALQELKNSRHNLFKSLCEIDYLKPYDSQANYIMCECKTVKAKALASYLLDKESILIKELTSKVNNGKEYIRIAVRNKEDNLRLVTSLKNYRI